MDDFIKIVRNEYEIFIDKQDEHFLQDYNFVILKRPYTCYVSLKAPRKRYYAGLLHRLILNAPDYILIDHIDGNGLNCRRKNLRFANYSQNGQNKRSIRRPIEEKGVRFCQIRQKWSAYITLNKVSINLGRYNTKQEAITARKEAEIKYFGEFNGIGTANLTEG